MSLNPAHLIRKRREIMPHLRWRLRQCSQIVREVEVCLGLTGNSNERAIAALRNRHSGQRAFIIGSGPSLKKEDLVLLQGEVTFASNKIYLLFNDVQWRPTYYSVIDVLVAENNRETIQTLPLTKVFTRDVDSYFPDATDIIWISQLGANRDGLDGPFTFSRNCLRGVQGGWSVVFMQMQLAYFMGIRELYLLGLDFSFHVPKGSGEMSLHGQILSGQGEINHFHPDYRKPGETWTMPRLELQAKAFEAARCAFEKAGGSIFNASRNTKLEVFPRICLEDALER